MQVLGLLKIEECKKKHADARAQLDAWRLDVEAANWNEPQDIKNHYATASFLAENRIIFNIKGNSYRLVVKVKYKNGLVLIEWIGTHAEYTKQKFE